MVRFCSGAVLGQRALLSTPELGQPNRKVLLGRLEGLGGDVGREVVRVAHGLLGLGVIVCDRTQ